MLDKSQKLSKILIDPEKGVVQNGALCYLPGDRRPKATAGGGLLGGIQNRLKANGFLYRLLRNIIKPVMANPAFRSGCRKVLGAHTTDHVILHIGSGPTYLMNRKDIINVDIFAFKEVDLVADGADLPLLDESADLVVSLAVLEHTVNPEAIIKEIFRITKPGGGVVCYLPFLVPYHAAPDDFHRWTSSGIRHLFSSFQSVDVVIGAGPTSALLWTVQEWLAIAFSFGNKSLHDVLLLVLMTILSPLKLIDLVMAKMPGADRVASGFGVFAKK